MKKKEITLCLLLIIVIQSFFLLFNLSPVNAQSIQDDSDLEVKLHCSLETNSSEIDQELMNLGNFPFFEHPELDVSYSDTDLETIDITDIQEIESNTTTIGNYSALNPVYNTNYTINSTTVNEYTISAPMDSIFTVALNYTTENETYNDQFWTNVAPSNVYPEDICYKSPYYYVLCEDTSFVNYIRVFDTNWNYITQYTLGRNVGWIFWNGTYWYTGDYTMDRINYYSTSWSLLGVHYTEHHPDVYAEWLDAYQLNGNWYFIYSGEIYNYTNTFQRSDYIDNYDHFYSEYSHYIEQIGYDGENFILQAGYAGHNWFFAYNTTNFTYLGYGTDVNSYNDDPHGFDIVIEDDRVNLVQTDLGDRRQWTARHWFRGFSECVVINLSYSVLGVDYVQIIESQKISEDYVRHSGNMTFEFDTTALENYDHIHDLTIYEQNITLKFLSNVSADLVNFSVYLNYSINRWRLPTEINLQINSESVIDETYNSGSISFDSWTNWLNITCTSNIVYRLDISIDLFFEFNLNVISKTYLRKYFTLTSDHLIQIERIDFSEELQIKKIYLNNDDLGNSNPTYLSPAIDMDTGNLYKLEVILSDFIYLPLNFVYGTLGFGTVNVFLVGFSDILSYNNINQYQELDFDIPTGFNPESANLTFSNIRYEKEYESNPAFDTFGLNVEQQDYDTDPIFSFKNSSESSHFGNYLNNLTIPANESLTVYNGTLQTHGTLGILDSINTTIESIESYDIMSNDNLSLHTLNQFPDNVNDGAGTITYTDYVSESNEYIHVVNSHTDTNGLAFDSRNLFRYDHGTNFPCESCNINFDQYEFGNFSHDICYLDVTSYHERFGYGLYSDSTQASWNEVITSNWNSGLWSSIPLSYSSNYNHWLRFVYSFECRDGISDNSGWEGLNSDQITLKIYDYNSDTWYDTATISLTNNVDYINSFHFTGSAGNYMHEVYYHDFKVYSDLHVGYPDLNLNLNATTLVQFENVDLESVDSFNVSYAIRSLGTGYAPNVNFSIYNFEREEFEIINSSIDNETFYLWNFTKSYRCQNYINESLTMLFSFFGKGAFTLFIDVLTVNISYINDTTLHFAPSLFIGYKNPVYVNEEFNITISVLKFYYNISYIWFYDNKTNNNVSIGFSEGIFNRTLNFTTAGYYNISCFVNDTIGNFRMVNISFLSVWKKPCFIDILNMKSAYFQNDTILINATVRDYLNNPIPNLMVNYTLINQTDHVLNSSYFTTDIFGNIVFNYTTNFSQIGFFHLNFSIYSQEYLNYSKLMSFEVLPFERIVNSTDIGLSVNSFPVFDNFIQINWTDNFVLSCYENSTFDLDIIFKLNLTENIAYNGQVDYDFTYHASTDIDFITFTVGNMSIIPANFTHYYFDNALSSNYEFNGTDFAINDIINELYLNGDSFSVKLRRFTEDVINRTQITSIPYTNIDSVIFQERLYANRSFGYWYFYNPLDINSVSLYHIRTATTISSFEINESKYYFDTECLDSDYFISTTNYDPNWYIDFEVLENNGTYSSLTVDYSADFSISNVSIVIDLENDAVVNDNWTLNATQTNYILTIPNIEFNTSIQTLSIEGFSSIPYAVIDSYVNEKDFTIDLDDYKDIDQYIDGYLYYYKYSIGWIIAGLSNAWTLDGIHYMEKDFDLTDTGYFVSTGYGTSITSSYLRFKTNPIDSIKRTQEYPIVKYVIDCNIPLTKVNLIFKIEEEERYTIKSINLDYTELVYIANIEGFEYWTLIHVDLDAGKNTLEIVYERENIFNSVGLLIPIAVAFVGFGIVYYLVQNKKWLEKLKFWKRKKR